MPFPKRPRRIVHEEDRLRYQDHVEGSGGKRQLLRIAWSEPNV